MGNRLSKLYTRTGDSGTSGLSNGERVSKTHPRMQAMGSVDELNSVLGLLINKLVDNDMQQFFSAIQHDLFNIGGEISMPEHTFISSEKITLLENKIDEYNQHVAPLKEFILPGGCEAAAICHIARATARRAERDLIALHEQEPVSKTTLQYLNRLSDLLFAAARIMNLQAKQSDVLWKKELS